MNSIEEMLQRSISHKAKLDASRKDVKDNNIMISEKSKELKNLNELSRITKYSCNYLDTLIKEESGKFIKKLNAILDYGVKTIFFDCDYSVEIRVSDKDKATIHLVYDDTDTGVKLEPDIKNCGGGIRTAISTLMQVFYILYFRTEPILFVDEGFSQLSDIYVPRMFGLLNELALKNNFRLLLITHDQRFIQYANKRYEIKNGNAVEIELGEEVESYEGNSGRAEENREDSVSA